MKYKPTQYTNQILCGHALEILRFLPSRIAQCCEQYAIFAHLEYIKTNQGLLTDETGVPLGFNINTKPFKGSHFAVFPRSLIKPCILASTSPKACGHCRAPYIRVTQALHKKLDKKSTHEKHSSHITGGWQPTCDCTPANANGKCLVLDPFIGSGTTAIEAINNGRNYIGIEISKEYVEMARHRIKIETQQTSLFSY